jgi:hypothetical protein
VEVPKAYAQEENVNRNIELNIAKWNLQNSEVHTGQLQLHPSFFHLHALKFHLKIQQISTNLHLILRYKNVQLKISLVRMSIQIHKL